MTVFLKLIHSRTTKKIITEFSMAPLVALLPDTYLFNLF